VPSAYLLERKISANFTQFKTFFSLLIQPTGSSPLKLGNSSLGPLLKD
jgi:hypothetical protein